MNFSARDFDLSDPRNPEYSLTEIDYYASSPKQPMANHRLSLRKNLKTGTYEAYRTFYRQKRIEIVFSGTLAETVEFCIKETYVQWGYTPKDTIAPEANQL